MPSVYDTLYGWARKTTTSFTELRFVSSERNFADDETDGLAYRLKHWPELLTMERTADILRTLSVMSSRPVNRNWILTHSRLHARQVDSLLEQLMADDAVEVIDTSKYGASAA